MSRLRDTYDSISFRGRLLLLLIVVSLVQAMVAGLTFNSLQSKPVEQRFQAQLDASLRAMAPVVDAELQASAKKLQQLTSTDDLVVAVENRDVAAAAQLLGSAAASDDVAEAPSSGASAEQLLDNRVAYVTDATGAVIAGDKPDAATIDKENITFAAVRRGSQLLGQVHVPVVLDEQFMRDRLGNYVPKGVDVFVTSSNTIVTEDGTYGRPDRLKEGLNEKPYGGAMRYMLVQPVLDGEVLIGASVPKSVLVGEKQKGAKNLIGFIVALVGLMFFVSFVITRAVADALRKFAEVAGRLAGGELSRRIPVTGDDEVADLATSFNEMAENLEQRIENLIEARAQLRRQVDLFGEALANATEVEEMLTAVCGLAIESTGATHGRFWVIDEDGRYQHAACVGLRPNDQEPCGLEKAVTVKNQAVRSETAPYWLVVPAYSGDTIVGLLTLVSTGEPFDADDVKVAERIAVQAAVAIDNARMHERLRLQATKDGLTGLPNHRSLQDQLRKNLDDAYRSHMPLGVALMDIDNFKRINDTYGHQVGDEAIKALARVLSHGIGEMGMAARYGGEEFVVLMPGCDAAASCRIADRLREDITHIEVPLEDGGVLTFTASFGVANVDQNSQVVENAELMRQADVGLYNAKRSGKNRVELAGPDTTVIEMSEAEKAKLAARERGEDTAQAA